jgi:hypothetical protein
VALIASNASAAQFRYQPEAFADALFDHDY